MFLVKSAKIFFFIAVLLFVAKPFLGFSMFSRSHPPAGDNIFVKVFSKRKVENEEDSNSNFSAIEKKLAEPVGEFFVRFSFLLAMLFPVIFEACANISTGFLRNIRLGQHSRGHIYLLNFSFLIWYRCGRSRWPTRNAFDLTSPDRSRWSLFLN